MTRDRIARLPDDDWRKRHPRFREPQLSRTLDLVERLTTVAAATTPRRERSRSHGRCGTRPWRGHRRLRRATRSTHPHRRDDRATRDDIDEIEARNG